METVKRTIRILALALAVACHAPAAVAEQGWQWIEASRVYRMLSEGSSLWLIDVRNSNAYESEHIEGAVNITGTVLRFRTFPPNRVIVLADDSLGQREAQEAARMLVSRGCKRVFVIRGGIVAWERGGLPLNRNRFRAREVSRKELEWALSNGVPLKIVDMRDAVERKKGMIRDSMAMEGKDLKERVENLRKYIAGNDKGLRKKLDAPVTIVLVLPGDTDPGRVVMAVSRGSSADIRYLEGGYDLYAVKKSSVSDVKLGCPTCPGKGE